MTTFIRWVSTPTLVIVSWLSLLEAVRVDSSLAFDPYRITYGMDNVNFLLIEFAFFGSVSLFFYALTELIIVLAIKNRNRKSIYSIRIAIRLPLAGLAIAIIFTAWERNFPNLWFYVAGATSIITVGDYLSYIMSVRNDRRTT
ncbi:hypothetical protein [Pseudomonas sp. DC3000-4b1]|uniref:hypothetical protein n=1 Tax=unclassified Pseudomonas TaxID=196821 RepID=UPI003CFB2DFE